MPDQPVVTDEDRGGGGFLNHLPSILRQRRWAVIIPLVLISLAGLAAALLITPSYRSTATLLVESQDLPADLVKAPTASLIDRRVARLQERVLSRENLVSVVRQHGLYEAEQRSDGIDAVIAKVRGNVLIEPERASGGGWNGDTTIALELGFSYPEPAKAQAALQTMTTQFLELNAARSADQAQATVQLLATQASELQSQLRQLEGQITTIKSQYGGVLASVGAPTPIPGGGTYDAQIMALQRDNNQLMQAARTAQRDPNVVAAESALAAARATYADRHPDVVAAEQRLREARNIARQGGGGDASALAQAQIASNNAQIAALTQARAMESGRASATMAAQARAPAVMDRVAQLENRANIVREQFQEVSGRLLAARNLSRIDNQNLGERLTLSAAASLPDSPSAPNRPLLIIGGVLIGLLAGVILAVGMEMAVRPVRGVQQIEQLTGVAPLVVIPILKPGYPNWARPSGSGSSSRGQRPGSVPAE